MRITSWHRQYVAGEGFYLVQEWRFPGSRYREELRYGPWTYDEFLGYYESVVFGYLELALAELEHDQGAAQHDE